MYSSVLRSWFFFLAVLRHKCSRLTIKQTGTKKLASADRIKQVPIFFLLPCHDLGAWNHVLLHSFFSTQAIQSAIYKIYLYLRSMYEKTYIWHQFLDEGDHSCHVMEDLHMLLFHPLDGESIIVLLLLNNSNLKHKAGHIISSSWYLSANQIQDKSCTSRSEQFSYLTIKVV